MTLACLAFLQVQQEPLSDKDLNTINLLANQDLQNKQNNLNDLQQITHVRYVAAFRHVFKRKSNTEIEANDVKAFCEEFSGVIASATGMNPRFKDNSRLLHVFALSHFAYVRTLQSLQINHLQI
jgi:hypothetical protein